jgi:hypothetical protein
VVSYSLTEKSISVGEPIQVEFSIRNQSSQSIVVDLGMDRTAGFEVSISREDGQVLAGDLRAGLVSRSPYSVIPGGVRAASTFTVAAGQTFRHRLLLNDWYRFTDAGVFYVDLNLKTPVVTAEGSPVSTAGRQTRLSIQLGPHDSTRLSTRCAALYDLTLASEWASDRRDFEYALASVQDPVAVPYLRKMLMEPGASHDRVIDALWRIGNFEAVDALIDCAHQTGDGTPQMCVFALRRLQELTSNPSLKARIAEGLR